MDYQAVEQQIRSGYRQVCTQYRRDDEVEVTTDQHRRVSATLKRLCESFPHPIRALDVGCGTGRYFHCLVNVRELLGIDISEEMLRAAAHPVRQEQITIPLVRLERRNVYFADYPPGSFHLVYSLGMFGNGCPVTTELCDKLYYWLMPGGTLYFNTIDVAGLPWWSRARRGTRRLVYPLLARRWQAVLDLREARHPFFGMTRRGLERVLGQSRFSEFEVTSHVCRSPLWAGRHLECLARKAL